MIRVVRLGNGCGSVGRAVDSGTRDLRFEPRQRQNFIYQLYDRKDENKGKEAWNGTSLKKLFSFSRWNVSISPKSFKCGQPISVRRQHWSLLNKLDHYDHPKVSSVTYAATKPGRQWLGDLTRCFTNCWDTTKELSMLSLSSSFTHTRGLMRLKTKTEIIASNGSWTRNLLYWGG